MANLVPNPTPGTVTQQGTPRVPGQVPATGNPGLAFNLAHPNLAPPGTSVAPNGAIIAQNTSFAGPKDTIVAMPDGSQTVLMANGAVVTVPAAPAASSGGGGGGGGGGAPAKKKSPIPSKPTKVIGPQKVSDLLPAFSPPALNQAQQFYDPGQYAPVAGSSNIPQGYTGPTVPDMGGQSSIANLLGVPWSAQTLNLQPGQAGYGLPPVDMSKGGGLQSNYVNPQMFGYVSPTVAPAWYQGARSTAK